jgi:hypothetical protein
VLLGSFFQFHPQTSFSKAKPSRCGARSQYRLGLRRGSFWSHSLHGDMHTSEQAQKWYRKAAALDSIGTGGTGSHGHGSIKAHWGQCWRNAVRRALTELWPQYEGQPQKASRVMELGKEERH